MNFKIGCQTLPYSELPLSRALEGIARAGYEYVCLYGKHAGGEVLGPESTEAELQEVKRLVEGAGLQTVMMFMPGGGVTVEGGADLWMKRLEEAKVLGAECVLAWGPWEYEVWPGKKFGLAQWRGMCDEWFEAMKPVAKRAEEIGMLITLKPHTGLTAYGNVLRATIERVASPQVQVCYDGGNVHFYEGLDPALDIKDCAEMVKAICVKDHVGLRANPVFPVPGAGDVDHKAMLEALKPHGFEGPVVVERFEGMFKKAEMIPELIDALAAQTYQYLKRVKAELAEG
ncbi:MAG: sugar phosphate isomerase/epimerase [Armatimonadia bacterium]